MNICYVFELFSNHPTSKSTYSVNFERTRREKGMFLFVFSENLIMNPFLLSVSFETTYLGQISSLTSIFSRRS